MSRGKSTCKVLKEVRRKIADANGIPLEERECTHKGDCAGTCPYCEAEVRYLERELSKRKSLGKAVAVAGIAMAAVTMTGEANAQPVSTKSDTTKQVSLECSSEDDAIIDDEIVIGLVEDDDLPLYIIRQPMHESAPKPIEGYEDARFLEEYGTPASWLRSKLTEFNTYIQQPRMDEVEIRFFVEVNGSVSSVVILNMPKTSNETDEAFRNAVREALLSMPRWHRASVWGRPVSALITLKVSNLR